MSDISGFSGIAVLFTLKDPKNNELEEESDNGLEFSSDDESEDTNIHSNLKFKSRTGGFKIKTHIPTLKTWKKGLYGFILKTRIPKVASSKTVVPAKSKETVLQTLHYARAFQELHYQPVLQIVSVSNSRVVVDPVRHSNTIVLDQVDEKLNLFYTAHLDETSVTVAGPFGSAHLYKLSVAIASPAHPLISMNTR
ncbi:hypothetical protein BC833DRAFT_570581 [Globomyces pollinis-pini]|nr:hypothetical protein BC833DRAFT_570581 [Globomyces pollinis-pini]